MSKLIVSLLVLLITGVGTLVALEDLGGPEWLSPVTMTGTALLVLAAAVLQITDYRRTRLRTFRDVSAIREFMFDWINSEGKILIFSNDMSWVAPEKRIKALLLSKARASELTLCLPRTIPLSEELRNAGAQVRHYSELNYVPQSRFTVIRYGRQDAEVAIGRSIKGVHTIEVFSPGTHPAFAMAEDLINIVSNYHALSQE